MSDTHTWPVIETEVLFLADGTPAALYKVNGLYGGMQWHMTQRAVAKLGRDTVRESGAATPSKRRLNDLRRGFTVGLVRVLGYDDSVGCGPDRRALEAGDYEVITTSHYPG